ncbi:MAG: Rrf2 family transcriptional regulator [Bdellovibrionales bacterium]
MLKITRKIEYSLVALQHLATRHQGELTTAKEISDLYGVPFDVVAKVMQTLAHSSVLKSEQGPSGGYLVQKDLTKISFLDLVEIVEGPMGLARCLHQDKATNCEIYNKCNIVSPISYLNEKLTDFYRQISVSELLKQGRGTWQTTTNTAL